MVVLGGGAGRARCARLDIAARAALSSQVRAEVARHPVDLEVVVFYELDAKERLISALYSRPLQHLI